LPGMKDILGNNPNISCEQVFSIVHIFHHTGYHILNN